MKYLQLSAGHSTAYALVDLDHRDPALVLVGELGLAAQADDPAIAHHVGDQVGERLRVDLGVGIDGEHELVEARIDADDVLRSQLILTMTERTLS